MGPALLQMHPLYFAMDLIITRTPKEAKCVLLYNFISNAFSHLPQYLTRLIVNRGGGHDIDDINDIRNGLLLSQAIHKVFGLGHMTFLMVISLIILKRALVDHLSSI